MPNKNPSPYVSDWINFMRAFKNQNPEYEAVSRKYFYPFIRPLYWEWQTEMTNRKMDKFEKVNYLNNTNLIKRFGFD